MNQNKAPAGITWYEFDLSADGRQSFQIARDDVTDRYYCRTVLVGSGAVFFQRQVPATCVGTYCSARRRAEMRKTA